MSRLHFRRFTRPAFLREMGRPLLEEFLGRFAKELAGTDRVVPPTTALDQEYFNLLSHLVMSPEGLPDALIDALHAIEALATPEGQQRIEAALAGPEPSLSADPEVSAADLAMRAWLASPELIARLYNEHRLARLTTFHHFGACAAAGSRFKLSPGEADCLRGIEALCDRWFAAHHRGRRTTRIEMHRFTAGAGESPGSAGSGPPSVQDQGDYWFIVRHGDTVCRTLRFEEGRVATLHYRPAIDDVVVYAPRRDELRINARTSGERELYRAAFGQQLFGDPARFAQRRTYTLEPLRVLGAEALEVPDGWGIARIVLRGIELALPGELNERHTFRAEDVFEACRTGPTCIPTTGILALAAFEVHFKSGKPPGKMQLRPPNTLKLSRQLELDLIEDWLALHGFRVTGTQ